MATKESSLRAGRRSGEAQVLGEAPTLPQSPQEATLAAPGTLSLWGPVPIIF